MQQDQGVTEPRLTDLMTITERVREIAARAPIRSPERRAAAALHTALITTKTPDAARRALRTFCDTKTRAAAVALLGRIERETAPPGSQSLISQEAGNSCPVSLGRT